MASDIFINIEGIEGESRDRGHQGEIDVESFSWGVSQTGSASSGGGGGAGKAQFQDFSFTANTSKASPQLMLACAKGQHLKSATLSVRTTKGREPKGAQEFMHIKFTDLLISSYSQSGNSGAELPVDSVSLNFSKIEFSVPPETARWDLKENREA